MWCGGSGSTWSLHGGRVRAGCKCRLREMDRSTRRGGFNSALEPYVGFAGGPGWPGEVVGLVRGQRLHCSRGSTSAFCVPLPAT
jgi:hypothetical protein